MLMIGQKIATYYESEVNDEYNSIDYDLVGRDFRFILVSNTVRQDYSGRIGKPVRTVVIRTTADLPFKEDDKIEWEGRVYKINDIPQTDNKFSVIKTNKVITMVG